MKITGYKIQHKLKELEQLKEVAAQQFNDNIMQFESQSEKLDLRDVYANYTALEKRIARLQAAQCSYNQAVTVNVLGESMSLLEAVKLVGGAGRSEKMWKDVVKGNKSSRHHLYSEQSRSKDQEYAVRSVSVSEAVQFAQQATKVAGALREAIQVGNATEVELDLDQTLLA
jgi:hypothetical protein